MRILLLDTLLLGSLVLGPVLSQEPKSVLPAAPYVDGDEGRLLVEGVEQGEGKGKGITWSNAGDYTLVKVPWNPSTTLGYNETAASTIASLGNLGLLVGGLYLLSGFQGAAANLARSDPLGLQRRFNRPEPPRQHWIDHKSGQEATAWAQKKKTTLMKKKAIKKRPFSAKYGRTDAPDSAEERQLVRPRFPALPRLRMPTLRPIRIRRPSLPALPTFRNPFARPSRPAPAAPVFRPAPRPTNPAPLTASQVPLAPVSNSIAPPAVPETSSFRNQESTLLPETPATFVRPAETANSFNRPAVETQNSFNQPPAAVETQNSFNQPTAFDFQGGDPFDEFRNSDFGDSVGFRNLLDEQFGDFQFDKIQKRS